MIRRLLAMGVLTLGLVGLSAGPAAAGWGYWSPSPCRADVEWYATNYGIWYWLYGYSEYHGAKLVPAGYFLDTYRTYGYECGFLGAPLTNKICVGMSYSYIDFQGGRISGPRC